MEDRGPEPGVGKHKYPKKSLMNSNLRYSNNNEQQPITVTKELHTKNKYSNIICNLWLLSSLF